jgi:formate hydrogenlyase transcriptional activator
VGSACPRPVDVRLVAATNRELAPLAAAGQFRADLYYRLYVFPMTVPPLRQRVEDIPLLVRHFVRTSARQLGKRIDTVPAEALAALTRHQWPGTVRELQNVIERAVILSSGPVLELAWETRGPQRPAPSTPASADAAGAGTRAHPAGAAGHARGGRGAAWRRGAPGPAPHDAAVPHGEARHRAAAVVMAGINPLKHQATPLW